MTKHEIAKKIADLTSYRGNSLIVAIFNLAAEVEEDAKRDDNQHKEWYELQGGK
jgi:hypothetical protein